MLRLSFSKVDLYLQCPLKYKYRYVDNIKEKPSHYASFGTSIHKAVQLFYTQPEEKPTEEDLYHYLDISWVKEGYHSFQQEELFKVEAHKILSKFYKDNIYMYDKARAVEQYFEIHTHDFIVVGYIDQINKKDNHYEIIEYKTSKNGKTLEEVEKDLQIVIYHLAFKSVYGFPPYQVVYYNLRSGKKIPVKVSTTMEDNLWKVFKETAKNILNEHYTKRMGNHCKWCDYHNICPDKALGSGKQISFQF